MQRFIVTQMYDGSFIVERWNDVTGRYEPIDNQRYSKWEDAEKIRIRSQEMYDEENNEQ